MSRPKRARHDAWAILIVAAAVRLAFALDTRGDLLFSILTIDARSYCDLAARFAAGDFAWGREALWFPPLYPALLGALFRALGPDPVWAKAAQFALGAATAAIVTRIGGRISRAGGIVAGLLLAFSPVALFHESQLLYTSLSVFLTALFIAALLQALDRPGGRRALLAGGALGLLGLTRSNALLFLPVAAWLAFRRGGGRPAAALAAGTMLVLLPVLLRNGIRAGEWTPLTVNGGFLFADGFAEGSAGARAVRRMPQDYGPGGSFQREAEAASGRPLSLAEASRFHRDRTLARIREDPGAALRVTARKAALLATAREIDDNLGFPTVRNRSIWLSWLPSPWAWMLVPAVLGAVMLAGRRDAAGAVAWVLIAYAIVYCTSILPFFVNARYRLPLLVPLAALGGGAVAALGAALRAREVPARLLPAGLAAGVAAFAALRDPGVRTDPALELLAVGAALEQAGHHEDALSATDRALARKPDLAGAHHNRALSLRALDRREEALAAAERATALDPGMAAAWTTRGALLAEEGRIEEALPCFRRAVELAPEDAAARANLQQALRGSGQASEEPPARPR
jgi:tetratricopeptide (TPR) repeat protein